MNFDNGFSQLEAVLRAANLSPQSEEYLNLIGWNRQLHEIEEHARKFGVLPPGMQSQREQILRELDIFAIDYIDISFLDLCQRAVVPAEPSFSPSTTRTNAVPLSSASGAKRGFAYDVFISYSHHDEIWVQGWLLSRLKSAGLSVCIDVHCFEPGAVIAEEIERAVVTSRKVLLVLSPEYIASEWAESERQLAHHLDPSARKRRIIPIMFRKCELRPWLSQLLYIDFTRSDQWLAQTERLLSALEPAAGTP